MATQFDGAFNDIGLVDLIIQTPMGNLTAKNLGPADVAILACSKVLRVNYWRTNHTKLKTGRLRFVSCVIR